MTVDPHRVFVKRLPTHYDDIRLSKLFAKRVGAVDSAWVATDRETGVPTGLGFVNFTTPELASKAVETAVFVNGVMLEVQADDAADNKENRSARNPKCELLVKGLPWDATDEVLYRHFQEKIGEVKSARVLTDRDTGQLRDIGFVCFSMKAAAKIAVQQSHFIKGKMLDVQRSNQGSQSWDDDVSDRKLFVKGVPTEYTEEKLYKYFAKRGSKAKLVRVATDRESGESRGFAHVILADATAAEDVKKQAHFINGKALTVRWSEGDTSQDTDDSSRTLFVRGFSSGVSDEALYKYFTAKYADKVETARVATDWETGESRCFGHVIFHEESGASKATSIPHFLEEKLLEVRVAGDKGKGKGKGQDDEGRTVFVGRIPEEVTDEELYKKFQGTYASKVKSARVIRDRETGDSRGFGFVIFKTDASAQRATSNLHFIRRTSLEVRLTGEDRYSEAWTDETDKHLRTLTVHELPAECEDEDLFEYFSQYTGCVEFSRVTAHRAQGTVVLESRADAEAVTQETHSICGSAVIVESDCDGDRRIRISSIPRTLDNEGLHKYFTHCVGPVQSARVVKSDHSGEARFGIVVLRTSDSAQEALNMNHFMEDVAAEVSLEERSGKGKGKGKGKEKGMGKWKDDDVNSFRMASGKCEQEHARKKSKRSRNAAMVEDSIDTHCEGSEDVESSSVDLSFGSASEAKQACVVLSRLTLSAKVDPENRCRVLVSDLHNGMTREELENIFAPAEEVVEVDEEEVCDDNAEEVVDAGLEVVDAGSEAEEEPWDEDEPEVAGGPEVEEAWSEDEEFQQESWEAGAAAEESGEGAEELLSEQARKRKSQDAAQAASTKSRKLRSSEAPEASAASSSDDWIEMISTSTGTIYYYNTKTGESKLDPP